MNTTDYNIENPNLVALKDTFYQTDQEVMVSISSLVFNHVQFIEEALDGFLMQRTNFRVEIVIHDDASTDGTTEILKRYEAKYPHLIKLFVQPFNTYKLPNRFELRSDFRNARKGKYIALCEGDDYWTDPLKLQKQVDFLEANEDYAICASLAARTYDDGITDNDIEGEAGVFSQEDLAKRNFIPTASAMFRKEYVLNYPDWALKCGVGDWPLFLICSNYGNIKVLNEQMVVRRIHAGGIWGANINNQNRINNIHRLKETFAILKDKFSESTNQLLNDNYLKQVVILIQLYIKQEDYTEVNKHLKHLLETGINSEEDRAVLVKTITDKMLQQDTENKTLKSLNTSLMTSTSYKLGRQFTGLFKFLK